MSLSLIPNTITLPTWLPPQIRAALSGREVSVVLPRQVKQRLRLPEKIRVSEWAEKYRVVTEIDAFPGPWRNDLVPHAAKIMDTAGLPWVREVWMCMPERAAKTQILTNVAMAHLDQGGRSGNIFWLMPTELDARQAMGERIIPVLRACSRTAHLLSKVVDDTSRGMIRFKHGVRLRPAWSNSPSSMASYFGRLNIADECDKFALRTSEGTDPITLFLKRARDDRYGSTYLFASTPGNRYIYPGTMACQQVWQFRPCCPECKQSIQMDEDHLLYPPDATAETMHFHAVEYVCNECGAHWDEGSRKAAYLTGGWHCVKGAEIGRPETVGFHMTAFDLPTVPLMEIAAAKVKAETGDIIARSAFANGYKVMDYEEENKPAVTEAALLRFRSELPRNLVPPDTARLVLMADTQQDSFYYEVWAFGYGPEIAMHMVRHGQVQQFADLEGLLAENWLDHEGKGYRIAGGLIDSGGTRRGWQKHSRTVEVYEWCSRNRVMIPHKGMHGRNGDLISYKTVATFPGTNKPIKGGLTRANLRVDLFKDELERMLAIEPDDPGSLSFHGEIDEAFARHYTAETKDEDGDWIHNRKNRNDYWDCTVYAVAYREMVRLRMPRRPEAEGGMKRRILSKGVQNG